MPIHVRPAWPWIFLFFVKSYSFFWRRFMSGMVVGGIEDDASMTPLMRIQKYAQANTIIERQQVAKVVLQELRTCPEKLAPDLPEIMKILGQMSDEPILRSELLEEIPHIAAEAIQCSNGDGAFKNVVSDYLIPLVVRSLGCTDNTLIAHSTLINLIKQGFITKLQAEIQVCPAILALTKLESTTAKDVNKAAINLMSKLAPLLGRDVTERVFLGRFIELCSSPTFHIRKICAAHFGYFAAVVSKEVVEKILVPEYLTLCTDTRDVRKACADVITYLSCTCSRASKVEKLAPVFGSLLQDECQWVRASAFRSLGFFISTFAEPPITELDFSSNDELVLVCANGVEYMISSLSVTSIPLFDTGKDDGNFMMNSLIFEFKENDSLPCLSPSDIFKTDNDVVDVNFNGENKLEQLDNVKIDSAIDKLIGKSNEEPSVIFHNSKCDNTSEIVNNELKDGMQNIKLIVDNKGNSTNNEISQLVSNNSDGDHQNTKDSNDNENKVNNMNNNACDTLEDDLRLFYSHNYWYISPDMPLDPNLVAGDAYSTNHSRNSTIEEKSENKSNNSTTITVSENDVTSTSDDSVIVNNISVNTEPDQTIVPQILIDSFVSMTYSSNTLNIEHEMIYHCAYYMPAVVMTLGREHWNLLENTVFALAGDVQYKVRRIVASSLHELATILGPELATNSLTILFEGFLKDLDEVRIGVLKNLTSFLEVIHPCKRNTYLPRLIGFLQTDNEWNWRFREELAVQLLEAIELFKPSDVAKHFGIIALQLLYDKVAAVRTVAVNLVTEIVTYISSEPNLTCSLLRKLVEGLAHSKNWKRRQTFCLLCTELLKEDALDPEQFTCEVMPHLLDLSWDPVANVRLVVARCISNLIFGEYSDYFANSSNENYNGLENVLRRLQADKDNDVRQSAERKF
ncbi:unnamed protein product [Phyllotreta striolata]|uniref:Serine/threonine-protein phosphatase 4 regulatory subunit 1 n=1 Tax=Phyllotreta striolata TaxID=444603 RepID=A0A9N9TL01_PHYSR|nr:unnamed protein product [Phyllotreta striolata]